MAVEKPDLNDDQPESEAEKLASNTEQIAQSARQQMADIDKEFGEKLNSMGSKISSGKSRYEETKVTVNSNPSGLDPESARGLGTGLTIAYAIIGMPLVGWAIGALIDRASNNTGPNNLEWAAVLTLLGSVVGVTFAIFVASRMSK